MWPFDLFTKSEPSEPFSIDFAIHDSTNGDLFGLVNKTINVDPSSSFSPLFDTNTLLGLGLIGSLGTGIFNAWQGYQANQLAKQQYKFQRDLANRNIANQAKVINNAYDNAGRVTAGLLQDSRGMVSKETVDRLNRQARSQYVNGSAI